MKLICKTDDDILVAEIKITAKAMMGKGPRGVWLEVQKEIRRAIQVEEDKRADESARETHRARGGGRR